MESSSPIDVAVVGTLNMDVIVRVARMPRAGETILGTRLSERPGGKGANQALAAAGVARTALIGAVGNDDAAHRLIANQHDGGVELGHLHHVDGISGRAIIEVDDRGDNRIIVLTGANAALTACHVERALDALMPKVVLTQLESPHDVTDCAAAWALANDRRFLLNPSPVCRLDEHVIGAADPLIVNENEAVFYAGGDSADDPTGLARRLLVHSRSAVVTMGGDGVVVATADEIRRVEVEQVRAVDTTGAGDLFAGILAGHLARGATLIDAVAPAAAAATEFVARPRDR
ncbi:ribokinase [Gordonia hankookensis]|uniref:Ribokinase n=1 Tax=Gordonia hankookensis TaxID=589403 RepID=A0ABR7WCL2_9ACTN|nr:ribokinase [Gordonia hankookensis]MBD1320098.1 ribokinase [Gordonia hankookensis]